MLRFASLEQRLAPSGRRHGTLRTAGESGLLPAFLIAALLFCHGVLGFAHQVSSGTACEPTVFMGAHHGFAAESGASGLAGDDQASGAAYAAVVVAVLGAAVLVLLGAARGRWLGIPVSRTPGQQLLPVVLHRLRGQTLPSLQVYRL